MKENLQKNLIYIENLSKTALWKTRIKQRLL